MAKQSVWAEMFTMFYQNHAKWEIKTNNINEISLSNREMLLFFGQKGLSFLGQTVSLGENYKKNNGIFRLLNDFALFEAPLF